MWVLDHLDDLESDLSRFHGVEDLLTMPAARFIRLSERVFAYDGVMRVRVEQQQTEPAPRAEPQQHMQAPQSGGPRNEVTLAELAFTHPGIVEVARAR